MRRRFSRSGLINLPATAELDVPALSGTTSREPVLSLWTYSLIPLAALVLGAIAAAARAPSPAVKSGVQHFAAGLVFAAAASEILPDLKHEGAAVPMVIGGTLGLLLMFGVKQLGARAKGPFGSVAVTAFDLLVDGLVLGIGFAAGAKQGLILTVALTIEVLFLGLSIALELRQAIPSPMRVVGLTTAAGLLLPLGILIGAPASTLPLPYLTAVFAFSLIALLYLVIEELLVEAHTGPESPFIASLFFVGFLLLLVLEEMAL